MPFPPNINTKLHMNFNSSNSLDGWTNGHCGQFYHLRRDWAVASNILTLEILESDHTNHFSQYHHILVGYYYRNTF